MGRANTLIFGNPKKSERLDPCGASFWISIFANDNHWDLNGFVAQANAGFVGFDNYQTQIKSIDNKPVSYTFFNSDGGSYPGDDRKFTLHSSCWTWLENDIFIMIKFHSCNEYYNNLDKIPHCISSFELKKNANFSAG